MNSETALYLQLYNSIIEGIATGRLKPGERMPTVRKLGIDLGINLHTVNKAYALLKQKGYLSAHRNKGAVVNEKAFYLADDDFVSEISSLMQPMIAECMTRGMNNKEINDLVNIVIDQMSSEQEGKD